MPNWSEILGELKKEGSTHDILRRKYLESLSALTGRNTILYYSGWLQKGQLGLMDHGTFGISDSDKTGFMTCIHKLDRSKGLDLVLHTPGGSTAATESLVDYLRAMFGTNIRAIVQEIAMSAGTMICCASTEIIMGKHSSLGPIDPQIGNLPAHGIIEEFNRASSEVQQNPATAYIWQPILAKYNPALIGECQKAIAWSEEMTKEWLVSGMFLGDPNAAAKATKIIIEFGDHALTKSHSRHMGIDRARNAGLKVTALEDDDKLQDAVLSVHHICIQTLMDTPTFKIIENQEKVAFLQQVHIQTSGPFPVLRTS